MQHGSEYPRRPWEHYDVTVPTEETHPIAAEVEQPAQADITIARSYDAGAIGHLYSLPVVSVRRGCDGEGTVFGLFLSASALTDDEFNTLTRLFGRLGRVKP